MLKHICVYINQQGFVHYMSINLFQYEYYKRELILVLVFLYTPIGVLFM